MDVSTKETTARLAVHVWIDMICPWCYIGEERLDTAISRADHGAEVDVRLHTFQLDPSAPEEPRSVLDYLAQKFGISRAQARAMEENVAQLARAEGLPYAVDHSVGNTFDALRLVHLAAEHRVAWEFLRAVQRRVFSGDEKAFEHDTLIEVGAQLGVPERELRDVLGSDRFADVVQADHQRALALGVTGVPFVLLGDRLAIPGAASTEQYAAAIDQAWQQTHSAP